MALEDWKKKLGDETLTEMSASSSWQQLAAPCLTVLYHDDHARVGESCVVSQMILGEQLAISRLEPLFSSHGRPRRPLADPHLSRKPLLLGPLTESGLEIDRRSTSTRVTVDDEPLTDVRLLSLEAIEHGVVIQLAEAVTLLLHLRAAAPDHGVDNFGLVGDSDSMLQVRRDIERVASLQVPVLLRGETGTGKEMVARAIHQNSSRAGAPLVCINMAAVPPSLAAAELFGASRGAYTGATAKRKGFFDQADGGTLFLDEIGETPDEVQPLLLRALESGEIQSVGSEAQRRVNVRFVAATDAKLEEHIAAGRFRAPLLHRLAGYDLRLPPLRDRRDDLGRLFFYFLAQELDSLGVGDSTTGTSSARSWLRASLITRLAMASWPGNVRQLRNVARQLVIVAQSAEPGELGRRLRELIEHSTPKVAETPDPTERASTSRLKARPRYRRPSEIGHDELLETLEANHYLFKPTAQALGISRTSLYHLIDRSDQIRKPSELAADEMLTARDAHGGDLAAAAHSLKVSLPGFEQRLRQLGLL